MKKNCLGCSKYLDCLDPARSPRYICSRHAEIRADELVMVQSGQKTIISIADYQQDLELSFDVQRMMDTALKNTSIVAPDLKVPDGDFAKAPNFVHFVESPKYLNQKPYVMQAVMGTMLFADYCPRCSDTDWLTEGVLGTESMRVFHRKVALYEHGKCPHCKITRKKSLDRGLQKVYDEFAGCAGQRSGKSAVVAQMSAYVVHQVLKLQNPNGVYGLLNANILHGTFCALTYGQAKANLWDPLQGMISDSPWFCSYHEMLTELGSHGNELFKFNDTFLDYKHRKLRVYPAAPDMRVLRGRTRIVGGVDEIAYFDSNAMSMKIRVNGPETYKSISNSLRTIRGKAQQLMKRGYYDVPTGYFLNISSPFSERDMIMELVRKAQFSKRMYAIHRPTWGMNPDISRESLDDEFMKDPIGAMRDFGAQPPMSANPFITQEESIVDALTDKPNKIKITFKTRTTNLTKEQKKRNLPERRIYGILEKVRTSRRPSVLSIDAGLVNNSFALTVMSKDQDGRAVLEAACEVMPRPNVPLNYRLIYDHLMKPLILKCNVQLLSADRWNSAKILSDAEVDFPECETRMYPLIAVQYSLKYADMLLFKDHLYDGQLDIPALPKGQTVTDIHKYDHARYPQVFQDNPIGHLVLQMLTVQDTRKAVIKGDGLTDDILRSAMLGFTMLQDERFEELWLRSNSAPERTYRDIKSMVASRHGSGGGTAGMSGGAGAARVLGSIRSRSS